MNFKDLEMLYSQNYIDNKINAALAIITNAKSVLIKLEYEEND